MKVAVLLCFLLIGAALSDTCTDKAKAVCKDAMAKYPVVHTKMTTCRRLRMFQRCMAPISRKCYNYFKGSLARNCV